MIMKIVRRNIFRKRFRYRVLAVKISQKSKVQRQKRAIAVPWRGWEGKYFWGTTHPSDTPGKETMKVAPSFSVLTALM